ncbi:amidohydrolase family protein [Nakamurella flavida]|uniref:Amidohydrolase family protein n=1 Tax=Nakamurella flavida TaxID=363630 RepID=A0A939C1D9_9ACTN|nr:amidohydrolase family protein [Nakamurella flavida]MBM9475365.1 amidohydrolase family protein [Nakamurella flavida]MDP9776943.1 putative amidohydrolase YtcJ [Nakamurella flavida]
MTTVLYRDGRLHSAAEPEATALAVTDGVISWLGGEHAVTAAGHVDETVWLDGALIVPGFVDAHVHATDAGLVTAGVDLTGVRSARELLDAVAAASSAQPAGVLWGAGWDVSAWPDPTLPDRAELDRAAGDRPVYLARVDVHSALISTALAAAAGSAPQDAALVDREKHARARATARAMVTPAQRDAAQRAFLDRCVRAGIVEVHENAAADAAGEADLAALLAQEHPVRVRGYLARLVDDAVDARAQLARTGAWGLAGDLSVDGALGSHSAALTAPYADRPGTSGARYLTVDEITAHLQACTEAGIQAGFHAIGDDAIAAVAEGFRRVLDRLGPAGGPRIAACAHRVEHVEMPSADDLAVFARCGVIASVQPLFDATWGGPDGMYAARLGTDRAAAMNPFAALAAAGVSLALGSDAPVTVPDPWAIVQAAVHHQTAGSGLSPRSALVAHTRGGHRAARRTERGVGTIGVGAPADLAVVAAGDLVFPPGDSAVQRWSTDPRSRVPLLPDLTPGAPLPTTLATLVDGRVVWDSGILGG